MSNERSHERLPVHNVVQVAYPGKTAHRVENLSNISSGGLGFRTTCAWESGDQVHIILQTDQTFEVPAIVRWCKPHDNPLKPGQFDVGVEFLEAPDAYMIDSLNEMESTLAAYQVTAMIV